MTRRGGGAGRLATRYQPLLAYLAACPQGEITLTFVEIAVILGTPLSITAQTDAAYWISSPGAIGAQIASVGWQARLDRRGRHVVFSRIDTEARHKSQPARRVPKTQRPRNYQPLRDYLTRRAESNVILTFAEIEAMIGAALPVSAYVTPSHLLTVVRGTGRRVQIEQRRGRVVFTRVAEEDASAGANPH